MPEHPSLLGHLHASSNHFYLTYFKLIHAWDLAHAHSDWRVMKLSPSRFWEMPDHGRPALRHLRWSGAPLSREIHIYSGSDHPWPTWYSDAVQHWRHELSFSSKSTHYLPERDSRQCLQSHSAIQAEQAACGKSLTDCRAQRKALPWSKTLLSKKYLFWRIEVLKLTVLLQQCNGATTKVICSCVKSFFSIVMKDIILLQTNKWINRDLAIKHQISQDLQ